MPYTTGLWSLLPLLHYGAPFLVLAYFLCSTLWSVLMLQTSKSPTRPVVRRLVQALMSVVIFAFLAEGIVITIQIFTAGGPFASKDFHVYAFAEVLVWTLMLGVATRSENHIWYPYCGAWASSCAIDIAIGTVELTNSPAASIKAGYEAPYLPDFLQLALQVVRIGATLALLATIGLVKAPIEPSCDEEETTPLLAGTAEEPVGTAEDAFKHRARRDAKRRQNERDKKFNGMQEQLHGDGNWFTYARRFLIFWPYLWPKNRPRLFVNMVGVAICLILERAMNIIVPRQFGILVNDLTAGFVGPSFVALFLYLLFDFLSSFAGVPGIRNALWIPVESNARVCLDVKAYNHVMELSSDFHDNKIEGELFTAIRQGYAVTSLLETLLYELGPMVSDLILALVYFWVLFDSYLVLIAAATMVAYVMSTVYITNFQVNLQRNLNAMTRRKFGYQYDTISKWTTVAYFNRIPHVEEVNAATNSVYSAMWQKGKFISLGSSAAQNMILDIGCFGAFTFAVYQVVMNGRDIGSFMTLLNYWGRFTGPLVNLASTHKDVMTNLVDAEELRKLFEKKPSVKPGPNELEIGDGEVTFEDLSFSYDGKTTIIDDLSLKAKPGQTIAFIGETGAGKSTLLKLLFRYYDPIGGAIKIDGQDIRDVSLESLREHFGVVPQEPILFNDTILANLRFSKLDVSKEEAVEACKAAAIHDRIEKLPEGYDSIVGERGIKLSGGERQRVAIARAILKDPKIIILDEATSSVDNETEELIQAGLTKLCAGRTTFVIAHRLSTIMNADLIVVIKDGKVLEQGTSRQLFKRKGKYYSLWSKQMGIVDALTKEDEIEKQVGDTESPDSDSTLGEAHESGGPLIEIEDGTPNTQPSDTDHQ